MGCVVAVGRDRDLRGDVCVAADRILVTGGAGFLGSHLVGRLLADGRQVVVLDNFSRGHPQRLAGLACETVHGDVRDPAVTADAMAGCSSVVHMACVQGTRAFYTDPRTVLDVAVRGMTSVLAACEKTGCRDLLFLSSSEVYGQPARLPAREDVPLVIPDVRNPRYSYAGGKITGELMAVAWQREGVLDRVIIARPHNIFGPAAGTDHVIPQLCVKMNRLICEYPAGVIPLPVQGDGTQTRAFCYVDDCTEQLALLLGKVPAGTGVWHVGTTDERNIASVAHAVALCYGRQVTLMATPPLEGAPSRRVPDTSRIAALGYVSRVPFEEGLARTVDWYRQAA